MKKGEFPPGWSEVRVQRVLAHYEKQTEVEAVAEDETAYRPDPNRWSDDFTRRKR